jgi:hypothetical protein
MLIIENQAHFDEVVAFAKKSGKYEPASGEETNSYLKNRLDYLESYGGKDACGASRARVRLFKDFAPYSFGFVIERREGDGEYTHLLTGGGKRRPSRSRSSPFTAGPFTLEWRMRLRAV